MQPLDGRSRSRWPRGLTRRSAAVSRLRLWVRVPPGAWMSVLWVLCCEVEVSGTSWSVVQRSPTDCGASLCVIYKPREWGGPGPLEDVAPKERKRWQELRETQHKTLQNIVSIWAGHSSRYNGKRCRFELDIGPIKVKAINCVCVWEKWIICLMMGSSGGILSKW